jgi:hypothetical protein
MKYFFAFLILVSTKINSQNLQLEFEGVITYKTTIVVKNKSIDIEKLYATFGRESIYFFKSGKYKWVSKNTLFEFEIFNPDISKHSIITKYPSNDTIFLNDCSKSSDSVISVRKNKQMKILGIVCNSASFIVTNPRNSILRTIFYPKDSLIYTNSYYEWYKSTGQNYISKYTNSIPLRLEISDEKQQLFSVIYEAINIQRIPVLDNTFEIDTKLPIKE